MTSFLKTQVERVSKTTKPHDVTDKSLQIAGSIRLYVHVDQLVKLATFIVRKKLAVPAILGRKFCDRFMDRIYKNMHLVKLVLDGQLQLFVIVESIRQQIR